MQDDQQPQDIKTALQDAKKRSQKKGREYAATLRTSNAALDATMDNEYDARVPGEVMGVDKEMAVWIARSTVGIFSKLVGKPLHLRNHTTPKEQAPYAATTRGTVISAAFGDAHLYCRVQDQLSRIVFKSDPAARDFFTASLSKTMAGILAPVDDRSPSVRKEQHRAIETGVRDLLDTMVRGLEYQRVLSLWGVLYSGSALDIQALTRDEVRVALAPTAAFGVDAPRRPENNDVGANLAWLLAGLTLQDAQYDETADNLLRRLAPYVIEAIRRVQGGSYKATLMVARWLLVKVVDEWLRRRNQEPPPPMPSQQTVSQQLTEQAQRMEEALRDAAKKSAQGQSTGDPQGDKQPPDAGAPPREGDPAPTDANGEGQGEGTPSPNAPARYDHRGGTPLPNVQATSAERMGAILDMLKRMDDAKVQEAKTLLDSMEALPAASVTERETRDAKRMADEAVQAQIKRDDVMDAEIAKSRQEMADIIDAAQRMMRQQVVQTAEQTARMGLQIDVKKETPTALRPYRLSESDLAQAQRLRRVFERVLSRRRTVLEDEGDVVDVEAVIRRKVSLHDHDAPVFGRELRGRGFELVLLVDLSGSMNGPRIQQTTRALATLTKALDFPFATFHVRGFAAPHDGALRVVHVPKGQYDLAPLVSGGTPLLPALMYAVNDLSTRPDVVRHLLVLTDGEPTVTRASRTERPKQSETVRIGEEIARARRMRIHVGGLAVETAPNTSTEWTRMFGREGVDWGRITSQNMHAELVATVERMFAAYLRSV